MGNAFFVVWRESLEAFLIAGILYAWLKTNDPVGSGRRALYSGLAAGVGLALLLGWAMLSVQDELSGEALDTFQTATLLIAAALITQMVLWMKKHGRQMKARLQTNLATAANRSGNLGVAIVAALAVAREGAETVIFLYGLAQSNDLAGLTVGAIAGFAAAGATSWLAARSLTRLNIGWLLRLSSMLLLIIASALLVTACDRMIGSGWLPALLDPVWDSSAFIDDASSAGQLFANFSGYRARPALSTLLAWSTFWIAIIYVLPQEVLMNSEKSSLTAKPQVIIPIIPVSQAKEKPAISPTPIRDAVEGFFVRNRHRLIWVHVAAFVGFVVVIALPLFLPEAPETATPLTHFTTFANYLIWGLWFPLVFLSVIFTGRSWCGLFCPMGAATEWTNKVGLQREIPGWLRWEGTPAVSFIITTIWGQTVGVRDHPEAAALVFGGTMLAALVIGYLYGRKKRAWCRHLCPIGRLLGLYSRLGAIQFAPQVKRPGRDAYSEKGACPTMIDLVGKNESRHCIECFRCVNPTAKGSVRMEFRRPGVEIENIRENRANQAEAWFLFLDTGVALGAFLWLVLPKYQEFRQALGSWALEQGWNWLLDPGPSWLVSVHPQRGEVFLWLDFFTISSFMIGWMIAMAVLLASTTAAAAYLSGKVGGDGRFRRRFSELGYQYAPVAMVSLIIGLGALLFDPIKSTPLGNAGVHAVKSGLFLLGVLWSIWLSQKILARQGVPASKRWLPILPGIAGSIVIGACWWPAIFGA